MSALEGVAKHRGTDSYHASQCYRVWQEIVTATVWVVNAVGPVLTSHFDVFACGNYS
jgi:hypothetical protein